MKRIASADALFGQLRVPLVAIPRPFPGVVVQPPNGKLQQHLKWQRWYSLEFLVGVISKARSFKAKSFGFLKRCLNVQDS